MNFSKENVARLSDLTDSLGDILIHTGFGNYVDILSQIRLAAERNDFETFNASVVNTTLFGSMGALWEIGIEDENKRKEFEKRFCFFIDHLKRMGIENSRIDQVRRLLNK